MSAVATTNGTNGASRAGLAPPHNLDAEQSVLGAILLSDRSLYALVIEEGAAVCAGAIVFAPVGSATQSPAAVASVVLHALREKGIVGPAKAVEGAHDERS